MRANQPRPSPSCPPPRLPALRCGAVPTLGRGRWGASRARIHRLPLNQPARWSTIRARALECGCPGDGRGPTSIAICIHRPFAYHPRRGRFQTGPGDGRGPTSIATCIHRPFAYHPRRGRFQTGPGYGRGPTSIAICILHTFAYHPRRGRFQTGPGDGRGIPLEHPHPTPIDTLRTIVLISISSRARRGIHANHSDRIATGTNFGRHRGAIIPLPVVKARCERERTGVLGKGTRAMRGFQLPRPRKPKWGTGAIHTCRLRWRGGQPWVMASRGLQAKSGKTEDRLGSYRNTPGQQRKSDKVDSNAT